MGRIGEEGEECLRSRGGWEKTRKSGSYGWCTGVVVQNGVRERAGGGGGGEQTQDRVDRAAAVPEKASIKEAPETSYRWMCMSSEAVSSCLESVEWHRTRTTHIRA